MKNKKIIKILTIIISILIFLFTGFIVWYVKSPNAAFFFPELSKTFINRYMKYEWNCGKTENDDVQAILTYKEDICVMSFSGNGDMMNFDLENMKSWHELNNMTVGWIHNIKIIEINEGIKSIGDCTFINNVFEQLSIPSSVTYIGKHAFYNCHKLNSINYNGTVEQWNKIELDSEWIYRSSTRKIICTDGEINLY